MSFLLGASLFLGAMLNFWGVNIFMLNTQKTTKNQWNHLTCREQWHNKFFNIAASTIYCLKPTYGPYGILWISWNFLFDGGEQKLNPFQTNCHYRATPNSVVKGNAKVTCTNEHKRSPPPQLTVKANAANTTVDLWLPICPGTTSQELLGKNILRFTMDLIRHQQEFGFPFAYIMKSNSQLWHETIWKHTVDLKWRAEI